MSKVPEKAFLLAAGKGTRLRPYTDTMPKPMVPVGGCSIIHRTLQKLSEAGVKDVVVNLHHLAPVLEDHLATIKQPKILLSHETELLDTGGGVKKMLQFFNEKPFFMINGDALWSDFGQKSALFRLAETWDDQNMDMLLLLQPVKAMTLTIGVGDYALAPDGKAQRRAAKNGDLMFAGIRIVHPRLFDGSPDGAFSFLTLMDKAEAAVRLYGIVHDGEWHHISTPEELERVDEAFKAGEAE